MNTVDISDKALAAIDAVLSPFILRDASGNPILADGALQLDDALVAKVAALLYADAADQQAMIDTLQSALDEYNSDADLRPIVRSISTTPHKPVQP